MKPMYRSDYLGEYVITKIIIKNGKREYVKEWVDNPIDVKQISNRATCIAEHPSITDTFYKQIENHNGGNLGKLKMQIYGVESVWKKLNPTFTICKDRTILEDMIRSGFTKDHIVYTTSTNLVRYPNEFYLTPHNTLMNSYATAVWLACFDEHKEVFIVGFDHTNQKIVSTINDIMKIYRDVKCIHVTTNHSPHKWRENINFSSMNKHEYVSHCDI